MYVFKLFPINGIDEGKSRGQNILMVIRKRGLNNNLGAYSVYIKVRKSV